MGKTIGFTYDLKSDHAGRVEGPVDALAEFDEEETIEDIVKAIESGGHRVVRIGGVRNLLKTIDRLDVDIVFNLCEGLGNRNRESQVPMLLDIYGIPYVGSDALTLGLTLDKVSAKKSFVADGIPTPAYRVAYSEQDSSLASCLRYPLIVKPRHEGSSKGISENSIVRDEGALKKQIREVTETYQQAALIEEFVSGSEFTVLVIGNQNPHALPSVQIQICGKLDLGDLVYTSRRLLTTEVEYVCPSKIPDELELRMRQLAVRAYRSVDCLDFGRVDFRVDSRGEPFVLEVNPLPSLSVEDVFPMAAKVDGLSYEELVVKIIDFGLSRYRDRVKAPVKGGVA